jgi:hypothetical protein
MYGFTLEAEYKDGFVLRETEENRSPYDPTENFYSAIRRDQAEPEHGPLVRFSLIKDDGTWRHDIDWTLMLPLDHVRTVYFRRMCSRMGEEAEPTHLGSFIGYQYRDATGANQQIVTQAP